MNIQLKQIIDEKLAHLSEQRVAEVLDFVEFLEARERSAPPQVETKESNAYPAGIEQTLTEWSSAADEKAYYGL